MAKSSRWRALRHVKHNNSRSRGAAIPPTTTRIAKKVAASSAQQSRAMEATAANIFNVSAQATDQTLSVLRGAVRSALKDVANPRLNFPKMKGMDTLVSDLRKNSLRLGMRPLDDLDLPAGALNDGTVINIEIPSTTRATRDLEMSVLRQLSEGKGLEEIAEDLRMDVGPVQQSILKTLADKSLIEQFGEADLHYVNSLESPTGGVRQSGVEDQFSTIVRHFSEPALKTSAAQSAAQAAVIPDTLTARGSREGGQDRPEAERKVPTRSGRPIHPDTQRELARLYVEAREEAGLSVSDDVKKLAFGS